jgi:hypothetical protein
MREVNNKNNIANEEKLLEMRQRKVIIHFKSQYANPWEKVIDHIDIKESNYKGTKDVSRMREMIIQRKNDYSKKN